MSTSGVEAGDWLICGLDRAGAEGEDIVVFSTTVVFGVLKAPVEERWRRSNSSCSLGGRRGGAGPVANAPRVVVVVNRRLDGAASLLGKSLDILDV